MMEHDPVSAGEKTPPVHGSGTDGDESVRLLAALEAFRNGDFTVRLPVEAAGVGGPIADTFNTIVARNRRIAALLARIEALAGGEGGAESELDGRPAADAWRDMENALQSLSRRLPLFASELARAAHEVDHRARNALAAVQAIVRLGRAQTAEIYMAGVEGRVRALARAHEMLSRSRWRGAEFGALIEEELAPYRTRVRLDGPRIMLPSDRVQSVALIVHEMASNAARHGALSAPGGRVEISWGPTARLLHIRWRETGGPPACRPAVKGTGMRLIEASLNGRSGDRARFRWPPQGLDCEVTLVLCRQAAAERRTAEDGGHSPPAIPTFVNAETFT